jgi:HNH endonuclease
MQDKKCKLCDVILTPEIRVGFNLRCKSCWLKKVTLYRKANADKVRAYHKEYAKRKRATPISACEICTNPCSRKKNGFTCSEKFRLLSNVQVTENCWLWKGGVDICGYGSTNFKGSRKARAHRVAYELFKEPIPKGMLVLHRCDNPSCCNPDHLFVGTQKDNKKDQASKDRIGWKLKAADVIEIKKLRASGMVMRAIANLYKVGESTISHIINGRKWKHVKT